jgi:hypothetical protein
MRGEQPIKQPQGMKRKASTEPGRKSPKRNNQGISAGKEGGSMQSPVSVMNKVFATCNQASYTILQIQGTKEHRTKILNLEKQYVHINAATTTEQRQFHIVEAMTMLQEFETTTDRFSPIVYREMLDRILSLRCEDFSKLFENEPGRMLAIKMAKTVLYPPLLKATIATGYQNHELYKSGRLPDEDREKLADLVVHIMKLAGAYLVGTGDCLFHMDPRLKVATSLLKSLIQEHPAIIHMLMPLNGDNEDFTDELIHATPDNAPWLHDQDPIEQAQQNNTGRSNRLFHHERGISHTVGTAPANHLMLPQCWPSPL